MACMKRTTVSLPDDLAALAEHEARRRNVSVSRLVREALSARLEIGGGPRELPFVAIGGSGRKDTASRMEEMLAREWTPDRDR